MSITSCYDALVNVIAAGISAKSKYTGIPNQAPQRLPAVIVKWANTEPASQSFSSLASAKYARNAMRRTRTFEAVVVIGSSGQIKDEDIAARATAQALLDAIDDDTELGGACVFSQVNNIGSGLLEWDQQAMFTVRANVSVMEDL
jgi:hypothetical protein